MKKYLLKVSEELGLVTLRNSAFDVKLLCLQRFVRLFAYGGSTLILVAYFAALGVSKTRIGLFMTLTLVGDTVISFVVTLFADAIGRKAILAASAGLMAVSGVVFALSGNFWILLSAAIVGVISPSGNEIGPFRAIEESALAHLTPAANRGEIIAWYGLIGSAGAAFGSMACGWVLHYLHHKMHWNEVEQYRAIFWGYAAMGILKMLLVLALSEAVELERKSLPEDPETAPLLGDGAEDEEPKTARDWFLSKVPQISPESRATIAKLCILMSLDSLASGLVSLSWVTYFFREKFSIPDGRLGSLFFTTAIISAISMLPSASIAKRLGNIKTMVFTNIPSSIFLILIPLPDSLPLSIIFLILRSCTNQMDVVPRQAFVAAATLPHERTAAMGLLNVVKTCAQSIGPLITGVLAGRGLFWVVFVSGGVLKLVYNMGVLAVFSSHKTHDEMAAEESAEEERIAEEEEEEEERLRESEHVDE